MSKPKAPGSGQFERATVMMLLVSGLTLQANPVHLRCESLVNPLGIDIQKPTLSWQSDSRERNWRQSAYQIVVASRADLLRSATPDVWDSGKQRSGESTGIPYGGQALESRKRYYWTVRVWDAEGHVAEAAEPAWWEIGLLHKSDWSGKWIRWQNPDEPADESGIRWIWVQGQDFLKASPGTEAVFHLDFNLSELPRRTALFLIARGDWKVTVNGHDAGAKPHWNEFDRREIVGRDDDAKRYSDFYANIRAAFQKAYVKGRRNGRKRFADVVCTGVAHETPAGVAGNCGPRQAGQRYPSS